MTRIDVERFCPSHGGYVQLAACPIVATNEVVNGKARDRLSSRGTAAIATEEEAYDEAFGIDDADDEETRNATIGQGSPPSTQQEVELIRRRVRGALAPEVGSLLTSQIDGIPRLVLARAPGLPRAAPKRRFRVEDSVPDLPSPVDLMRHHAYVAGARPARACPTCSHPLPVHIDRRNAYPIALAGQRGSTKTTTVVALIEAVNHLGAGALGVSAFSATEATTAHLERIDPMIFARYRQRERTERTQAEHHPPLEFLTTLPGDGGAEVSVLLQDAAGEDLQDPDTRVLRTPSVLWSDVILFLYDPLGSPLLRDNPAARDQAVMLNGIRDDIESRGRYDASGYEYKDPPLVIAVSKADELPNSPDVRREPAPEGEVQKMLRDLRDASMVSAAARWREVHWRFIAPLPENGGEPQGVTDLFALLLSLLRR